MLSGLVLSMMAGVAPQTMIVEDAELQISYVELWAVPPGECSWCIPSPHCGSCCGSCARAICYHCCHAHYCSPMDCMNCILLEKQACELSRCTDSE